MKTLYIDTSNSGISGDMFLAALLELVPEPDSILNKLTNLKNFLPGVSELKINLKKVKRSNILTNQLDLKIKEKRNHRSTSTLKEALDKFLEEKQFSDSAKDYAKKVLNSLIQAELEVHGNLNKDLHLHELSSVDTLIDILGVTMILDAIGGFKEDFKIFCSKLPLGGGTIQTSHGTLPIPAPATSKILEKSNLIVYNGPINSELATPTGVALLANLKPHVQNYEMNVSNIVYAIGQKYFDNFLNILRIFYGDAEVREPEKPHALQKYRETISMLETDVDDVSGEILGNFIKKIEKEDILDVKIITSITKKNRPSHIIRVMCHPEQNFEIIEKILDELGTLGVRINTMQRVCVDRKIEYRQLEINNKKYDLRYKISFIKHEKEIRIVNIKPEYEDLKKISQDSGMSVKKILFFAQSQIEEIFFKNKNS